MALERIHANAGHCSPIGGASPKINMPFDGMDAVSSAMLMELASSVMEPSQPTARTVHKKYTKEERKVAIERWMAKRARRHLVPQTKYNKMKAVAVNKNRSKGGKFIKKSEREKLEKAEREAAQVAQKISQEFYLEPANALVAPPVKDQWMPELSAWKQQYAQYAQPEE